jgi:hypothetical protein
MKTYIRKTVAAGLLGLSAVALPGCEKFVTVDNPNNLEAEAIDPDRDATLLSQSVYTRYVSSVENAYVLGAWFTNHARVGDTFPTRNAVGQRNIPNNGNETDAIWNTIHTNIQFARTTIRSTEGAGNTVDLARAHWVAGFAIMQMAEYFCEGTIAENTTTSRGKMTVAALLDSAIVELQAVQTVVAGLPAASTEGTALSNAAQVGIARALLQLGRNAEAATAAAAVPAGFTYNITHIDNTSQRGLGNQVWQFSETRISLVVGPEFRAMADGGDTRVSYTNMNRLAQDGVLQFYRQGKHPGWAAPMRFASKLEADYIAAEASQNTATMLTLIAARRTAGARPAYAGATDLASVMTELMLQKSIDFWLEGHNMRDFRRNPASFPFVLPTGNNYYKPSLGPVGSDTCWPVPRTELERNLNWE